MKKFNIQMDYGNDAHGAPLGIGPINVTADSSEVIDPDEVVVSKLPIQVEFDYPLAETHLFTFEGNHHFASRLEIFEFIQVVYNLLYAAPRKYGIKGHDMSDLVIEGCSLLHSILHVKMGS